MKDPEVKRPETTTQSSIDIDDHCMQFMVSPTKSSSGVTGGVPTPRDFSPGNNRENEARKKVKKKRNVDERWKKEG